MCGPSPGTAPYSGSGPVGHFYGPAERSVLLVISLAKFESKDQGVASMALSVVWHTSLCSYICLSVLRSFTNLEKCVSLNITIIRKLMINICFVLMQIPVNDGTVSWNTFWEGILFVLHEYLSFTVCVCSVQEIFRCGSCQRLSVRWFADGKTPSQQVPMHRKSLYATVAVAAGAGFYYSSLDRVGRRRLRATADGFFRFFRWIVLLLLFYLLYSFCLIVVDFCYIF